MSKINLAIVTIVGIFILLQACKDDPEPYVPTPYKLNLTLDLPQPALPADNPLTEEGVMLGRMLFYDKALSRGESQACATCHSQQSAFVDTDKALSLGVEELAGNRNSMALINLAWHYNGFFWDGRAATLREQALLPIQDELEMDETLSNVLQKLSDNPVYPDQFEKAFGDDAITNDRIGLAIEQFMITLISNNSRYDQSVRGEITLTESEQRGQELFFRESNPNGETKGADCFHCHGGSLFTNNDLMNNGLDSDEEFTDLGFYDVTGDENDKAKFKVPSLRNVGVTGPYMHDGRMTSLEEVLDHYNGGAKESSTLDPNMHAIVEDGLDLSDQDMTDIINFLHTLTDETFLNNEAFANPFE